MKQMKFLLVALMTVLMGMSVTSCMNGDDNTIYTGPAFAKCTNYFPATFELANGQKLVVNELSMPNLNIGEIYFFYYQFDTAQQPGNSQTLDVTLYAGSTPTSISANLLKDQRKRQIITKLLHLYILLIGIHQLSREYFLINIL